MIIVYDYETGRFIRNTEQEIYAITSDEIPKWLKQNKRWIDTEDLTSIDIAYIYVENEIAKKENVPEIYIGEKYGEKNCITA